MKTTINSISSFLVLLALLMASCSKDDPDPTPVKPGAKSNAKDITAFSFAALAPVITAQIDVATKTISATVPATADITKLVPTLTISPKATVSPATNVAQDFTSEVSYTVTAEDASTQIYKVSVKKETTVSAGLTAAERAAFPDNADLDLNDPNNGLFANGGMIYLIGRSKSVSPSILKYVYEYNPATNVWTKKQDINLALGQTRQVEKYFTYKGKGYIVIREITLYKYTFFEFNLDKDPVEFTGLGGLNNIDLFYQISVDSNKIYFSWFGQKSFFSMLDFDQFKIVSGSVTYPGTATTEKGLKAFAVNNKLYYVARIAASDGKFSSYEFFELNDYTTNKWTKKATPPNPESSYQDVMFFSIAGKLYGQDFAHVYTYNAESDKWDTIALTSKQLPKYDRMQVLNGKSLYYIVSGKFYQLTAN